MSTSRTIRRAGLGLLSTALALVTTACPIDPPAPTPYHPERLAPGNVVYFDVGTADSRILSNPGGVLPFPTEPGLSDLRFDLIGYGNPTTGAKLGPIAPNHVGMFAADGTLQYDFGEGAISWRFSGDGSTIAVSFTTGVRAGEIAVFDTDDMSLRRTIPWPSPSAFLPTIADVNRDGTRVLVRAWDVGNPSANRGIFTATTTGIDPLVTAVDTTAGQVSSVLLTGTGRVAYFVRVPGGALTTSDWELRSSATDGTDQRSLGTFRIDTSVFGVPAIAAEIGSGRVLTQVNLPFVDGLYQTSQIIAVDDSAAATQTVIAGPFVQLAGLQRLVGLAP